MSSKLKNHQNVLRMSESSERTTTSTSSPVECPTPGKGPFAGPFINSMFLIVAATKAVRVFEVGQEVLACEYRGDKWASGKIDKRTGPLLYAVDIG